MMSSMLSGVILAKDWSRRNPALLTTTSTVPKASSAVCTIASPPSGVATESWLATALPPAAVISADHLLGRGGVRALAGRGARPGR